MAAYYNEIDPFAAQWLRELIKAGAIAPGDVDERSIEDVRPSDLNGYTQCHFFAGIGVWSYALRAAGWPDNRPIWTGSCPCQPFSTSGKKSGFDDERHLWPAFYWLIQQCRPGVVAGEQVASKAAEPWLDLVQTDLEALGYAFGALAFPSAGVGAPHIRDRTYWVGVGIVADTFSEGSQGGLPRRPDPEREGQHRYAGRSGGLERLADAKREQRPVATPSNHEAARRLEKPAAAAGLCRDSGAGPVNGFWADADWLFCRDGKWRPTSPLPQSLADGSAESLGRVCAEIVTKAEEAVDATAMETKIEHSEVLRNLLFSLGSEAKQCWPAGGVPGLHEAPFLLAFLRQLSDQGWRFKKCTPLSCPETFEREMRSLRDGRPVTSPSHQRGLEGWQAGEHSDAMRILSSVLARYTQEAWGRSYEAYAESCFVLTPNAPARVGRLRGYGNAINAEAAKAFIEVVRDSL